jgi:hypothetical protein
VSVWIKQGTIAQLVDFADSYREEAGRCADAGAFTAACVMMASTLEAMLLSTVGMAQHVLEPEGLWPVGDPFDWTLGRLVGTASRAGWFDNDPVGDLADAIESINTVRICCIHPGAYIRDRATPFTELQLEALFAVFVAADTALGRAIRDLPPPPVAEPD